MTYDKGKEALFQGYYGDAEQIDLNELARRMLSLHLNADRMKAGTIESKLVKIFADFDGPASITLDFLGFRANDGIRDTVRIGTDGKAIFRQVDLTNDMSTFSSIRLDTTGLRATDGFKTTFEIDTQGKAYFRGDITSDATITGAAIRTGEIGTNRIELVGNSLRGVSSNNTLQGLVMDMNNSNGLADVSLYRNGGQMLEFYDNILSYTIRPGSNSSSMGLGTEGKTVKAIGAWDFSGTFVSFDGADISGLDIVPNSTGSAGGHNHGIADGDQVRVLRNGSEIWVPWYSAGSHTHPI